MTGTYEPFPLDALPEPLRGFVTAGAKAIGCDPVFVALPALVATAAAIGRTRELRIKRGWNVPPILWAAIVAESGDGKSPAHRLAMRAVRDLQRRELARAREKMEAYADDLARWEKSFAHWKGSKSGGDPPKKPDPPAMRRYLVADCTVEALAPLLLENPRGLLYDRDELRGWLGSFDRYVSRAGTDAANWLSMFNSEPVVVDRRTGTPRTIYVPAAAVWISGTIQPGTLNRALGQQHRENGLAARLLLASPQAKAKRWSEADVSPDVEQAFAAMQTRLFTLDLVAGDDGEPRPGMVRLGNAARGPWIEFYNSHNREAASLSGELKAAWSKLEEYAARLALVVHFVRWAAGDPALESAETLDAQSMGAGIQLGTWFKAEARRVYALLDGAEDAASDRKLVAWIERQGGSVTLREVTAGCRWLRRAGDAQLELDRLAAGGFGGWENGSASPRGGRPARLFSLRRVNGTPENQAENWGCADVDNVDALNGELAAAADLDNYFA